MARSDRSDGGKAIRPLVLRDEHRRRKGIDKIRPHWNLPELWERPDDPVLMVEGEKLNCRLHRLLHLYHGF